MSRCRAKAPRGRARRPRLPPLGRQRNHRRWHRGADAGGLRDGRARNCVVPPLRDALPAGLVAVTDHEPSARRSERRQLRKPVSRQHDARQSRLRLHSGHGTVRRRVPGQRQPRGLGVQGRNLCTGLGLAGVEQLARLAVVRRGQALDEIRLSGRIPDARQLPLHEQPVHDLPREQRSAESDQRDHRLQRGPAARSIRRVLRAGSVDDGPDHTAGGPAVRSRDQHLPGRRRSAAFASCRRSFRSRKPRASMRTRT